MSDDAPAPPLGPAFFDSDVPCPYAELCHARTVRQRTWQQRDRILAALALENVFLRHRARRRAGQQTDDLTGGRQCRCISSDP